MNENKENICHIPVSARFEEINGEPVIVEREYIDVPADKIAAFLVERFGAGRIFKTGGEDS